MSPTANMDAPASSPAAPAPAQIQIRLDDQAVSLPAGCDLAQALLLVGHADAARVATALNGQFVPRALRAQTLLQDGDHLILFQPIVGG